MVSLSDYRVVDLIMGLQKRSAQDTICNKDYSTFPPSMKKEIRSYLQKGGKLLTSGSYVGADMISDLNDEAFTSEVLHYRWEGPLPSRTAKQIRGNLFSEAEDQYRSVIYAIAFSVSNLP